jgi:hypothetical protein
MLTDATPRGASRAAFLRSDELGTLRLPADGRLRSIAARIESAMNAGQSGDVRRACAEFLTAAGGFYEVPTCGIRVLAARPIHVRPDGSVELFGDYHPPTMLIRVWLRTAVRGEVTSFGTFLSTLCHEFCHHLDLRKLGFHGSWHTRGFFERTAMLYHHARGTPFKRLFWAPASRNRWYIDWPRTNRGG